MTNDNFEKNFKCLYILDSESGDCYYYDDIDFIKDHIKYVYKDKGLDEILKPKDWSSNWEELLSLLDFNPNNCHCFFMYKEGQHYSNEINNTENPSDEQLGLI